MSPHWQCYLLALRTASDIATTLQSRPPSPSSARGEAEQPGGSAAQRGIFSRGQHQETALAQVFQFVDAFGRTMVQGLSTLPYPTGGGRGLGLGGSVEGRGRPLSLAVVQERVDAVGLVAALGPCMARWRARCPETSAALLEVKCTVFCIYYFDGSTRAVQYSTVTYSKVRTLILVRCAVFRLGVLRLLCCLIRYAVFWFGASGLVCFFCFELACTALLWVILFWFGWAWFSLVQVGLVW